MNTIRTPNIVIPRTRPSLGKPSDPDVPTTAGRPPGTAAHTQETFAMAAARIGTGLSLLVVGVIHLWVYEADSFRALPVIGPLFLLNFVGSTAIGLLLLLPTGRLVDHLAGAGGRVANVVLSIGAATIAAVSIAFLLVSEHTPLFGFREYGYRFEILVALASEAATCSFAGAYLVAAAAQRRRYGA